MAPVTPAAIADAFDEMHKDNMRAYERTMQSWVNRQYQEHGEGWQFYGAAVTAGVGEALFDFLGKSGGGLVDLLRLGETIRNPSVGSVFRDGLRILMVAGPALRAVRMLGAVRVAGGPMSCTFTGWVKALNISGVRVGATIEELSQGFFRQAGPLAETMEEWNQLNRGRSVIYENWFWGTQSPMVLAQRAQALGAEVEMAVPRSSSVAEQLKDIAKLAKDRNGPVMFGVRWAQGGGHTMTAYYSPFQGVRFADQTGSTAFKQLLSVAANGGIQEVYPEAAIVKEASVVRLLDNAGTMAVSLPLYLVPGKIMDHIERRVRQETGRPAPGPSAFPGAGRPSGGITSPSNGSPAGQSNGSPASQPGASPAGQPGGSVGQPGGSPAYQPGGDQAGKVKPLSRITGLVLVVLDQTPQTVPGIVQEVQSVEPTVTADQVTASLQELQGLGAARMMGNGWTKVPGFQAVNIQPNKGK
jgi:hypothetical protein